MHDNEQPNINHIQKLLKTLQSDKLIAFANSIGGPIGKSILSQSKFINQQDTSDDSNNVEKNNDDHHWANWANHADVVRPFPAYDWSDDTLPPIINKRSLRNWWHDVLRHGHYLCYGIFLILPSDKESIRYLKDYGKELDLISGDYCWIMALSKAEIRQSGFDDTLWKVAVSKQASEGHSIMVSQLFNIEFTQFPCLILFKDVRKPDHVLISLSEMTAEEISTRIRMIFSLVQEAVLNKQDVLKAIVKYQNTEEYLKRGEPLIKGIRSYVGKTFEVAMEAWIKTIVR